jgi:hypothetical protein
MTLRVVKVRPITHRLKWVLRPYTEGNGLSLFAFCAKCSLIPGLLCRGYSVSLSLTCWLCVHGAHRSDVNVRRSPLAKRFNFRWPASEQAHVYIGGHRPDVTSGFTLRLGGHRPDVTSDFTLRLGGHRPDVTSGFTLRLGGHRPDITSGFTLRLGGHRPDVTSDFTLRLGGHRPDVTSDFTLRLGGHRPDQQLASR